jgi:peptidoglycan hydrolase-like protein with peptidoglycan-binding domain
MALPVLRRGSTGAAVEHWQQFLISKNLLDIADGIFGQKTEDATKAYQTAKRLNPDGVVGSNTYAEALKDGFDGTVDDLDFPPKPNFPPLVDTADREKVFGKFEFKPAPIPGNKEHIKILGDWVEKNIASVDLPALKGIPIPI